MPTVEEALEQGWREPAPTFFTEDQMIWFAKCHQSPWVLVRRTDPALTLDEENPMIKEFLKHQPKDQPFAYAGYLPSYMPTPRPLRYMRLRGAAL